MSISSLSEKTHRFNRVDGCKLKERIGARFGQRD